MENISLTKSTLSDILDLNLIENYINQLYEYIQVPITLYDIHGKILLASPWTKICYDYMQNNPTMDQACKKVCSTPCTHNPEAFTCPNGLMMYKTPIKIKEEIVAYLVLSQFLVKGMNLTKLEQQLHKFSLQESQISSLIKEMPTLDSAHINNVISFMNNFVFLLHSIIEKQLRVIELEEVLQTERKLIKKGKKTYPPLTRQKNQKKQMWDMVSAMGRLVESRDLYTSEHQKKVAILATNMAIHLKLDKKQIECIFIASLLHDIGKISIPSELLSKPDKLTYIEYSFMKLHSEKGADILREVSFGMPISDIVMQHHEKIDGSGYPNGLTGDQMMLEAKIIAVADVYDAITSHRPYRPSLGCDYAKQYLIKEKGVLYDARIVDACLHVSEDTLLNIEELYSFLYEDECTLDEEIK